MTTLLVKKIQQNRSKINPNPTPFPFLPLFVELTSFFPLTSLFEQETIALQLFPELSSIFFIYF